MPSPCAPYDTTTRPWSGYYYSQSSSSGEYPRMKDFLVAAASQFGIAAPLAQALGVMEEEGPGNNWLTLGLYSEPGFQEWWKTYNQTGVTYSSGADYPSTSDLESLDSLNAAGGIYWLKNAYSPPLCTLDQYPAWEQLAYYAGVYEGKCDGCTCPYNTAYGISAVLLAYGASYTSVSQAGYDGAQYCDLPNTSSSVAIGLNCGSTPDPIAVPVQSSTFKVRTTPLGRNSGNKQIVIAIATDTDYVSGLTVNYQVNLDGKIQKVVTRDMTFAANSASSSDIVVIACGSSAADDLAASGLTSASSFSSWSTGQYIDCGKATAAESYTCTYNNVLAADAAGY